MYRVVATVTKGEQIPILVGPLVAAEHQMVYMEITAHPTTLVTAPPTVSVEDKVAQYSVLLRR